MTIRPTGVLPRYFYRQQVPPAVIGLACLKLTPTRGMTACTFCTHALSQVSRGDQTYHAIRPKLPQSTLPLQPVYPKDGSGNNAELRMTIFPAYADFSLPG